MPEPTQKQLSEAQQAMIDKARESDALVAAAKARMAANGENPSLRPSGAPRRTRPVTVPRTAEPVSGDDSTRNVVTASVPDAVVADAPRKDVAAHESFVMEDEEPIVTPPVVIVPQSEMATLSREITPEITSRPSYGRYGEIHPGVQIRYTVEPQVVTVPVELMHGTFRTTLDPRTLREVVRRMESAGMTVTPHMRASRDGGNDLFGDIVFSFSVSPE